MVAIGVKNAVVGSAAGNLPEPLSGSFKIASGWGLPNKTVKRPKKKRRAPAMLQADNYNGTNTEVNVAAKEMFIRYESLIVGLNWNDLFKFCMEKLPQYNASQVIFSLRVVGKLFKVQTWGQYGKLDTKQIHWRNDLLAQHYQMSMNKFPQDLQQGYGDAQIYPEISSSAAKKEAESEVENADAYLNGVRDGGMSIGSIPATEWEKEKNLDPVDHDELQRLSDYEHGYEEDTNYMHEDQIRYYHDNCEEDDMRAKDGDVVLDLVRTKAKFLPETPPSFAPVVQEVLETTVEPPVSISMPAYSLNVRWFNERQNPGIGDLLKRLNEEHSKRTAAATLAVTGRNWHQTRRNLQFLSTPYSSILREIPEGDQVGIITSHPNVAVVDNTANAIPILMTNSNK